jgi:hypothetical protein
MAITQWCILVSRSLRPPPLLVVRAYVIENGRTVLDSR